jgi:DNA-binding GntR family transcriptional regulator
MAPAVSEWIPQSPAAARGASLSQIAYAEIKRRIITLGFKPGEFLNESTICSLLGLGRTPVHEALHMLKLEGLVEIIPRKGVMIRSDSLNDVIALLETRMIVEPPCIGLAAERAQPQHLASLDTLMQETQDAIEQGDRVHFMSIDTRFHQELVQAAANPVMAEVMRLLHERASRIWYLQVWSDDDLRLTRDEHEAIVATVKCGDRAAATAAAQVHLASLRRRILKHTA